MPLATVSDLRLAVRRWLNRENDLAVLPDSVVNEMIALAEAEMVRRLFRSTVRGSMLVNAEMSNLPGDCAALRSIRLITGTPELDTAIEITTPEVLGDRRAQLGAVAGRPKWATVIGVQLLVCPAPDAAYDADLTYYQKLVPLTDATPVNSVLTDAPDAYLFGSLLQAEAYLEHDERLPTWQAKFDNAISQLNELRQRQEYGASLRPQRLPVAFS